MSVILLACFLLAISSTGIGIAFFGLDERRPYVLWPVGCLIGIYGYTLIVNALSFLFPVQTVMLVVAIIFALTGVASFLSLQRLLRTKPLESLPFSRQTWRYITLLFLFIAFTSGLVSWRSRHADTTNLGHLPLASTIQQGNFPVMDPSAPDHVMEYHYAPELLSASMGNLTGFSVWFGHGFQIFWFTALLLALAFAIAYPLTSRVRDATLAAIALYFGGGFHWLRFPAGIEPLWKHFVLHQPVDAPWQFLSLVVGPGFNSPLSLIFHNHSPAYGFPLFLLVVFILNTYGTHATRRITLTAFVVGGLLAGHLAIAQETTLLILLIALMIVSVFILVPPLRRHLSFHPSLSPKTIWIIIGVVAMSLLMLFTQGGIVTSKLSRGADDPLSTSAGFSFFTKFLYFDFESNPFALISFATVWQFGLPLLLLPLALWGLRRSKEMLLLGLVSLGAFFAPMAVRFNDAPNDLSRLFQLATPLCSFIVAIWLTTLLPQGTRFIDILRRGTLKQRAVLVALLLIPVSGIVIQAAYVATPLGKLGQTHLPFFSQPVTPQGAEAQALDWISKNTTQKDRFFPFSNDFIRQTGRFAPGFFYEGWGYQAELKAAEAIVNTCSAAGVKKLKISYFYVSPNFPIADVDRTCAGQLNIKTVFASSEGGQSYRILRVTPLDDAPVIP